MKIARALWPRGLLGRLSIAYLIPTVLFMVGLILLADFAARATLGEEVGARLEDTAAATAASMPSGLIARFQPDSARTHSNLLKRLDAVAEAIQVRRIFLVDLQGRSIADTGADAPAPGAEDRTLAQDQYELAQVAAGQTAASVLYTGLDGVRYKRGFAPVRHEGEVIAVIGVEASAGDYAAVDALSRYMIGVGLFAVLALSGVGFILSRAISAPLARLAEAARQIGAGDLDAPVKAQGAEEIQILAETMEEMRDALQRRERELQLMLGGIAHEIRNPLGGMELFVGLLREDLEDQPDLHSMVSRVSDELEGLKGIVEDFLAYARRAPIQRDEIALIELAMEVQGLVSIRVDCDLPTPGCAVVADRARLRRLLLNLVSNAAQAGATAVTLKVDHLPELAILGLSGVRGPGAVITVRDDGPGIPEAAAARIFDAFYTTREKGTGLGLALCQRIAEEHGGRLTLLNPGAPGAQLQIALPEAGPSLRAPMAGSEAAGGDRLPPASPAPARPSPPSEGEEAWLGDEPLLGDGPTAVKGSAEGASGEAWLGDGEDEAWLGDSEDGASEEDEPWLGDGPAEGEGGDEKPSAGGPSARKTEGDVTG